MTTEAFEHVVTSDETGVYENCAFELSDEFRAASRPLTFTICEVAGRRIAVFFVELDKAQRIEIAAAKPEWIEAVVFAHVPESSKPVVVAETHAPDRPSNTLAFAATVVAQSHGAFSGDVKSCTVRFGQAIFIVAIDFDWTTESWHGSARETVT